MTRRRDAPPRRKPRSAPTATPRAPVPARSGAAAAAHACGSAVSPAPSAALAPVASPRIRTPRLRGLDAWRGLAMLAMIVYHFCFDLRWFGYSQADFEHDDRWIVARSMILGTFLLLAGASLVLAARRPDHRVRFAWHVGRIAGAAALVTAASYAAFPATFIAFGVLHAIAVALVVAHPLVHRPRAALAAGLLVIAAGVLLSHPAFDAPGLAWVGFMTHRPATEDYVPLFPWMGVVFAGIALGHALLRRGEAILRPFARLPAAVATLGRHGLLVYLVHQPLLVGALWLATRVRAAS